MRGEEDAREQEEEVCGGVEERPAKSTRTTHGAAAGRTKLTAKRFKCLRSVFRNAKKKLSYEFILVNRIAIMLQGP